MKARVRAEAAARLAKQQTHLVRQLASNMADLPPDEFADLVSRAFQRRPA